MVMMTLDEMKNYEKSVHNQWELDISLDQGKIWKTVKTGPSCDSCKTFAREKYHKTLYGINPNVWYRIYALNGEQLYVTSHDNRSWRMSWAWGNLKPRDQQHGTFEGTGLVYATPIKEDV